MRVVIWFAQRGAIYLAVIAIATAAFFIVAAFAETVKVPRSILKQYSPEQIAQAKQFARQNGIRYTIVDDETRKAASGKRQR